MSFMAILVILGVVVLDAVLIGLFVLVTRRQGVVDQRLGQLAQAGQVAVVEAPRQPAQRASPFGKVLDRAIAGRGFAEGLRRDLARADIKLTVGEYLAVHVLVAFGFFAVGWFVFQDLFLGILTGIASLFVPRMFVGTAQRRRLRNFENQLGDMLNLVVNGLRAGYSSMQALESVGRELPEPISVEFHRVVQEIQLGIPQEAALANLVRRMPSPDLDFVVTAINVQREVGGNLAEILDNISYTIRERVRIKGEIATLTAQGQITAWVISLLPIGLALLLFVLNRDYMMTLFGPPFVFNLPICGIIMIATALVMISVGFAIVQKIVDIEV
jgi:tight adherence protein B